MGLFKVRLWRPLNMCLASPRASDSRAQMTLRVIYCCSYMLLVTHSQSEFIGENDTRLWITGDVDRCEPFWRFANVDFIKYLLLGWIICLEDAQRP